MVWKEGEYWLRDAVKHVKFPPDRKRVREELYEHMLSRNLELLAKGCPEDEADKLDTYKRIAAVETAEEEREIVDELVDRFGEPPKPVHNLLFIARLKAAERRPRYYASENERRRALAAERRKNRHLQGDGQNQGSRGSFCVPDVPGLPAA